MQFDSLGNLNRSPFLAIDMMATDEMRHFGTICA